MGRLTERHRAILLLRKNLRNVQINSTHCARQTSGPNIPPPWVNRSMGYAASIEHRRARADSGQQQGPQDQQHQRRQALHLRRSQGQAQGEGRINRPQQQPPQHQAHAEQQETPAHSR